MMQSEPKLYVLTRRDLPWPVRTVQAVHAAVQLGDQCARMGRPLPNCPPVVLLGVADQAELTDWSARLDGSGFREPDLGGQLTAVAVYGVSPEVVRDLRLL